MKRFILILMLIVMAITGIALCDEVKTEENKEMMKDEKSKVQVERFAQGLEPTTGLYDDIPLMETGVRQNFADKKIEFDMPYFWVLGKLSDEQMKNGVELFATNPEKTRHFNFSVEELKEEYTIQKLMDEFKQKYENVNYLTVNYVPYVSYYVAENDAACLSKISPDGKRLYRFIFDPVSDRPYAGIALQIVASAKYAE